MFRPTMLFRNSISPNTLTTVYSATANVVVKSIVLANISTALQSQLVVTLERTSNPTVENVRVWAGVVGTRGSHVENLDLPMRSGDRLRVIGSGDTHPRITIGGMVEQ